MKRNMSPPSPGSKVKMEETCSSETLVTFHRTTRRYTQQIELFKNQSLHPEAQLKKVVPQATNNMCIRVLTWHGHCKDITVLTSIKVFLMRSVSEQTPSTVSIRNAVVCGAKQNIRIYEELVLRWRKLHNVQHKVCTLHKTLLKWSDREDQNGQGT
jgi:hypothetical protein